MLTLTTRSLFARTSTRALFSTSVAARAPGGTGGTQNDGFKKREKAAEDQYVHSAEQEKLKKLQESIQASKSHLAQLEKDHSELAASIKK